ncbi:MAG: ATP-binding cassette domain-containing protein [Bacteroidales bacterium]
MEKELIRIRDLHASYNGLEVLRHVDFTVREKDFIGIIGPNGGGKTTLLKHILGLMKPTKGHIEFLFDRSGIGYLPQGREVDERFPITVEEVVESGSQRGLKNLIAGRRTGRERMQEVLSTVGLTHLRSRPVGELSGGELQRTLLARAIISKPSILVLDEPDTHVDNRFEMELYQLLRELNKDMTILLVSHDLGIISPYIKTIACVNRELHYHTSNEISEKQLKVYNCPIEIITHGPVPHRVMKTHK